MRFIFDPVPEVHDPRSGEAGEAHPRGGVEADPEEQEQRRGLFHFSCPQAMQRQFLSLWVCGHPSGSRW